MNFKVYIFLFTLIVVIYGNEKFKRAVSFFNIVKFPVSMMRNLVQKFSINESRMFRMIFAVVQKEIEMELVTPKKNVAKEMVFKWELALKDTVFVALVSKQKVFCQ